MNLQAETTPLSLKLATRTLHNKFQFANQHFSMIVRVFDQRCGDFLFREVHCFVYPTMVL